MIDVACVGILVADAIAKPVEKIPAKGKLELVDSLGLYTGGCAASASIDMAMIGRSVAILGKIGNDGFGMFMKQALEKKGVRTEGLVVDQNGSTSASLVIVTPDGERSFIHSLGSNATFCENDVKYNIIDESKIVFVAGTMLMPKFDGRDCADFLAKCKKMGKTTALDTAWDSKGRWMKVLEPCMPYIDYFLPSYEEAVELSGKTAPEEIADVFLAMGPHTVVIKLGRDGCFIKSRATGERYVIPTFTRVKAVDTTGAGDAFCAGFLAALVKDKPLFECGRFANAVGTFCVMAKGASTGIKSEKEILRFIEDYDNTELLNVRP
ncbi:MAG: carbohydrate kinase family protein [Saccharofermentanales bacterium]